LMSLDHAYTAERGRERALLYPGDGSYNVCTGP
jgi:hypothetical protein